MLIRRIEGATRDLGAPAGWSEATHGPCGSLPIRDTVIDGLHVMISAWAPEPADLEALAAGGVVHLYIYGTTHPVVAMGVSI